MARKAIMVVLNFQREKEDFFFFGVICIFVSSILFYLFFFFKFSIHLNDDVRKYKSNPKAQRENEVGTFSTVFPCEGGCNPARRRVTPL